MSEWDDAIAKLTGADWQEIEKINSQIQSHFGAWGEMKGGDKDKSGIIKMPYSVHDPLIYDFLELWDNKGLIIPFNWAKWDAGRDWYASTDAEKYNKLDKETALKLITAVVRNGRFNEGALMQAFEDGDFPKIIDKFVALRGQ